MIYQKISCAVRKVSNMRLICRYNNIVLKFINIILSTFAPAYLHIPSTHSFEARFSGSGCSSKPGSRRLGSSLDTENLKYEHYGAVEQLGINRYNVCMYVFIYLSIYVITLHLFINLLYLYLSTVDYPTLTYSF